MTDKPAARSGGVSWGLAAFWLLKVMLALVFAFAGYLKLSGQPKMVAEFAELGLGQGFRYLTGLLEVLGAGLLLWPRTTFPSAVLLAGICGGALVAQVVVLHGDLIHVFVLGGLVLLAAWISRPAQFRRA